MTAAPWIDRNATRQAESSWRRWLKFNFVGIIGFGLQLGLLALFVHALRWNYLLATAVAVELTVIHNFIWHERYTWASRKASSGRMSERLGRFLHFNLTNGAVSLIGNLLLMRVLSGELGLPYLASNAISVVACALLNFLLCDYWVFQARGCYES